MKLAPLLPWLSKLLHKRKRQSPVAPHGRTSQLPRIYFAARFLIGLIAVGTAGFYLAGGDKANFSDAFYMTLITVRTVGYGEIVPVHGFGERRFAGLIALAGFGAARFLFTSLTVFFLESDLDYSLRRRRMENADSQASWPLHHLRIWTCRTQRGQ